MMVVVKQNQQDPVVHNKEQQHLVQHSQEELVHLKKYNVQDMIHVKQELVQIKQLM
jgi:hypothetical protein